MNAIKHQVAKIRSSNSNIVFLNVDYVLFIRSQYHIKVNFV